MKRIVVVLGLFVAIAYAPSAAPAASVSLGAIADNSIYAESDTLSNGAGEAFHAGLNGLGKARRGLLRFDLTGAVPSGAAVDSVVLTLHVSQAQLGSRIVKLHRVLASWGEGTSDAPFGEGQGAPATPGDATWGHRVYPSVLWTHPGGDFNPNLSAYRSVGPIGVYSWRSAGMDADVSFWLANPASNFGWIVIGNEVDTGGAKRLDSHQNLTPANRPVLTVYYTESPTSVADPAAPGARLMPAVPNPFNPATTIAYDLAVPGYVRLAVYDVRGRLVRVLSEGMAPRGPQQVVWRGDDPHGDRVASGVYLVRLIAGTETPQTQKIVLLK